MPVRRQRARLARLARVVLGQVHEVRDDPEVAAHAAERAIGLVAQIGRDRGHLVALLDGELGDRIEARLLAHQRDVGPVQRGDDAELPLAVQHLAGEVRRRGMRDGVVDVQEVDPFLQHDLVLLGRQRERVGEVVEQRIAAHPRLDLMEVDPLGVSVEAERGVVGDEVHLVAASRELEAQLGRDRARAAVGRIAGDPDLHCHLASGSFSEGDAIGKARENP